MKILMVVHQFLPRCLAGTEVYTYHLASELQSRGHEVQLFFTEVDEGSPQYALRRREYDGLACFEAVHNRYFPTFEHTYRDVEMEKVFARVLDEAAPDVVHIQHLQLHSIGYVDLIWERRLPVVWTLHEYMLLCLRDGQLLRPGGELCAGPEPNACAVCATAPPFRAKPLSTNVVASVAQQVSRFPFLLKPARALWRHSKIFRDVAVSGNDYVAAARKRQVEIQRRLDLVDAFLAPSEFLQRKFIEVGAIDADRIHFSPLGMRRLESQPSRQRPPSAFQVAFIGTITRVKGVKLILDALRGPETDGIECSIYGDPGADPEYMTELLASGTPSGVRYRGRLEKEDVSTMLASLDALIVPSIWYENAPLTIQEAFLLGVPVIAADSGGMAELVEDGRSGLLFRRGDAADLRRQLLRLRDEPQLRRSLRPDAGRVRDIRDDAAEMETRYESLLASPIRKQMCR